MNVKNYYQCCAVPCCGNTTIKSPTKLFIHVPAKTVNRNKWLELAGVNVTKVSPKSNLFFCEDHFDLPNDMENYMEYHLMGYVSRILMKPTCLPSKFPCKPDRKKRTTTTPRDAYLKRQRKEPIEKLLLDEKKNEREEVRVNRTSSSQPIYVPLQGTGLPTGTVNSTSLSGSLSSGIADTGYHWKLEHSYSMEKANVEARPDSLYVERTKNASNEAKLAPTEDCKNALLHEGFLCNVCNSTISGYRYTCVECPDYDLCGSCEARGEHCLHYVLRIPRPKPYGEIKSLLDNLRTSLFVINCAPEQVNLLDINDIKSEIKDEEDDPFLFDPFLDGDDDNIENNAPETLESEHILGDPLTHVIDTTRFVDTSTNNENIPLDNPNEPKIAESQHQITINTMEMKPIVLKTRNDEIPPPPNSVHKPEDAIKTDNKSTELVEATVHRDQTTLPRDQHQYKPVISQTDYKRLLNITTKPSGIKVISKQGTAGSKGATDRVIHVFTMAKRFKKKKIQQNVRPNGIRLTKEEIKAAMKNVR